MANQAQRRRDQEAERRAVNATLQAIATELKVIKADCLDPLEESLENLTKQREEAQKNGLTAFLPLAMTRTEQNRIIVFESNAGTLGRIKNDELLEQIARVYGLVAGLLDQLNANAREFERWRSLADLHPVEHPEKKIVETMLGQLEAGLRRGLGDLQRELAELFPKIDKYLDH